MVKTVLLNLAAIFCLLLATEGAAWLSLSPPERRPFLFDAEGGSNQNKLRDEGFLYPMLDPLLGWGPSREAVHLGEFLGGDYRLYGAKDPRALRLVITGGSTSDSFAPFEGMWPKVLIRLLREDGYCVTGFLGGVAGYASSQEMIKILRDRHALKPNLHISYSGVNEEASAWSNLPNVFIVRTLESVVNYRSFFLPNAVSFLAGKFGKPLLEGVNAGLPQSPVPSERWQSHLRVMHALSKEFNYEFMAVLQPMLGMGEYNPAPKERELMIESELKKNWGPFYREARAIVKKTPYAHDLTDIFRGQSGLYYDDCHVNEEGNRIVAEQMHLAVKKRYRPLLEKFRFKCD